jgi:diacylglycerol O-acyltransferase-1
VPRFVSFALAFFISAVGHELIIAVPFKIFSGWAFLGMLGQIPLVLLGRLIQRWRGKDTVLGNCVWWVFFVVLGQPLSVLLYYEAYTTRQLAIEGKTFQELHHL